MEWLRVVAKHFNKSLFSNQLPEIEFKINAKRNTVLHYLAPATFEIGSLAVHCQFSDFLAEILHNLVHVKNHVSGVPDHTRSNQYHNQHFAHGCIAVGLYVGVGGRRGWSSTSIDAAAIGKGKRLCPTPAAEKKLQRVLIEVRVPRSAFRDLCQEIARLAEELSVRKSKATMLKYVCKCKPPWNSIRSGRRPDGAHPLNITCNNCGQRYRLARGQKR